MGALIHIENMKKIYNPGENEVRALDGIDLDIEKGDLLRLWDIQARENQR